MIPGKSARWLGAVNTCGLKIQGFLADIGRIKRLVTRWVDRKNPCPWRLKPFYRWQKCALAK